MGIFDGTVNLWTTYRCCLTFRDKIMGGVPKDPKIIEGWLRSKAGFTEDTEELRQATLRTMIELGMEYRPNMTFEEIVQASASVASSKQTNGFKRDAGGLYIESRQIKAAIKESVNILFAGEKWGKTKKGPRNFTAERVFVNPDHIHLNVSEPTGIETVIGHVVGPQGPRSTLTYHEYVVGAQVEFTVMSAQDEIKDEWWRMILTHAQENGIGALRSQGYGRFDLTAWDKLDSRQSRDTQSAAD